MSSKTITSLILMLPALALAQAETPEDWGAALEDPAIRALATARRAPTGDRPEDLSPELIRAVERVQTRPGDLPRLQIAVGDKKLDLPLEHTHVYAEISGFVGRVDVVQTYHNPLARPIEAVYVFPLPENSAVDDMKIRIGDRVIAAEIKKRAEARRTYEEAKADGHTAALLEQERPNVFTQSVANIEPGAEIEVMIRYVQDLTYDAGEYEFVFPMVVGPRFVPGTSTGTRSGEGWTPDTDEVPDAARISPPILGAGVRSGHDISLEVHINAGLPIVNFEVPTHETLAYETDDGLIHVDLADHDSIPNRDFVLRYRVDGEQPQAALLAHRGERGGFFSLIVQPPTLDLEKVVGKRELVFVVDVSGSMFGTPLAMCKTAMRMAIEQLRPSDTFNVLTFAGQTARAFERSRPASRENINAALKFMAEAEAGGGTYMTDAVKAALTPAIERGRHRYVFFLTDGYVGNESQIFSLARQFAKKHTRRGQKARVFGFGVGSSVNRHLIDGLSKAGRGRAVYAGPRESPRLAVNRFFHTIDHPVLEDVRIDWGDLGIHDVAPDPVPDLFASRPLILYGRFDGAANGRITVSGRVNGERVRLPVDVTLPDEAKSNGVLATLWARSRIEAHEQDLWAGDDPEVKDKITKLGLDFGIVTAFTSFVAVDRSRKVGDGEPLTVIQPVEAPEGVNAEMAGGHLVVGGMSGSARGKGGLGLRGTGGGGAGAAFGVVVGHGSAGGAGVGYGRGVARLAGKKRKTKVPRVVAGAIRISGSLDKSIIQRVIRRHRKEIRYCYEKALQKDPKLAGKIVVRFVVHATGLVAIAKIIESTMKNEKVEQCIAHKIRRWKFPKIAGGGQVVINYPFVFQSAP